MASDIRTLGGKGFTLIELMIVVAIIGVLAALAIPAYADYVVRSQVSEGPVLAADVRAGIVDWFAQTGEWPASLQEIGLDPEQPIRGRYVESINVIDGVIFIHFGIDANDRISKLDANTLAIAPGVTANGDIVWQCGRRAQWELGDGAEWAGDAAELTTIEAKYLSSACR